jgi:hypothetical protein
MNTDIECRLTGPETPECFQLRIGTQIHDLHAWQLITLVEAVNLAWLHWLGLTRIDIIKSYLELDQREKLSTVISEQESRYGLVPSHRSEVSEGSEAT